MASRKAKAKPKKSNFSEQIIDDEEEGGIDDVDPEDVSVVSAVEPVSALHPGYGEYEIDIEDVLRQTLPSSFEKVEAAPLTETAIAGVPKDSKGAYLLFHGGQMVYAGKTDTRHGFRQRLKRHAKSVQQRCGLDPEQMTFKALRIMVFSAFDVEAILIEKMRNLNKENLQWNDSGFGSNDPGRKRDDGKSADFDKRFPVDVDRPLVGIMSGETTVKDLLIAANGAVPYKFRHVRLNAELGSRKIVLPDGLRTMRSIMIAVTRVLPSEFQATIFHGRVIMYREHREYEFALGVLRGQA